MCVCIYIWNIHVSSHWSIGQVSWVTYGLLHHLQCCRAGSVSQLYLPIIAWVIILREQYRLAMMCLRLTTKFTWKWFSKNLLILSSHTSKWCFAMEQRENPTASLFKIISLSLHKRVIGTDALLCTSCWKVPGLKAFGFWIQSICKSLDKHWYTHWLAM